MAYKSTTSTNCTTDVLSYIFMRNSIVYSSITDTK